MKRLLPLILLALLPLAATAQQDNVFDVGLRVGWSGAHLNTENVDALIKSQGGYHAGAFVRLNFGGLYLEPSLNIINNTVSADSTSLSMGLDSFFSGTEGSTLSYGLVDIPVMVGLHLLNTSLLKLNVFLGPVAGFITSDIKASLEEEENWFEPDDTFLWKGQFGASVEIWRVILETCFQIGLENLESWDQFWDTTVAGFNANRFNVSVGFRLF